MSHGRSELRRARGRRLGAPRDEALEKCSNRLWLVHVHHLCVTVLLGPLGNRKSLARIWIIAAHSWDTGGGGTGNGENHVKPGGEGYCAQVEEKAPVAKKVNKAWKAKNIKDANEAKVA
jgi:hypothetical protein